MGLFSRARKTFSGLFASRKSDRAIVEREIDTFPGRLQDIWEDIDRSVDSPAVLKDFVVNQSGAELFRDGFVDMTLDTESRVAAREAFFELMEQYNISREEFNWEAWRDDYSGQEGSANT